MRTPTKPAKVIRVSKDFVVGVDVGGTKTEIADSLSSKVYRYVTMDFPDLYAILDDYFAQVGKRPAQMTVAIAGPRNAETGEVQMTNLPWPSFHPDAAAQRYPGTTFDTTHDMAAVTAGIVYGSNIGIRQLKTGKPVTHGTKVAVTISTGVGACAAVWDGKSKRYIYVLGEAGHLGFQPYNAAEERHLKHIFTKYRHPSIELAISGKFGIESWTEHSPEMNDALELADAVKRAEQAGRPVGAVLLAFATEGVGRSREAARSILNNMGGLVGNALADVALAYMATGGLYMTGSVSMGLAEYWAANTDFTKAFIRTGTAAHAPWLEHTLGSLPIYLVTDPNIAVAGALALAKES